VDNPWREDPAGPSLPIPAAQLRGPRRFAFAYCRDAESAVEAAELFRHPFLSARGTGAGTELDAQAGPLLDADPSVVLTALQRDRARLVNESPDGRTVRFRDQQFDLRPWEIKTISL
jgi:hypothetical protein